jgi:hypothetical protein
MKDSTKLSVCLRLKEVSASINDLFESLANDSPDLALLADANAIHDKSAELVALILDAAKPAGAYAFRGDLVELSGSVEPGSAEDKANQRLSDGFRRLSGEIGAELERAS